MRQELLGCLWAIEQDAGHMTPALRELQEAASTPTPDLPRSDDR
jgi:hypothetical protein